MTKSVEVTITESATPSFWYLSVDGIECGFAVFVMLPGIDSYWAVNLYRDPNTVYRAPTRVDAVTTALRNSGAVPINAAVTVATATGDAK